MLQIKNLTINLREDDKVILKDFSFSLNKKDKVGLIGEEGNGKTILLKTILDRNSVETYCDLSGEISVGGETIGYLPQMVEDGYLNLSTGEYLRKNLDIEIVDYNQFYSYLSDFSLRGDIISDSLKLRQLSGGEKIKFVFIVELMKNPSIFLFDEPSNDLDLESKLILENFMLETDLPLIFVSHDRKLLSKVANKIIHLEQVNRRTIARHTISNTSYDAYVSQREEYIFTETKRAKKEEEEYKKKLERYYRVYNSVQDALTKTKNDGEGKNLKDKMHTVKAMYRRFDKEGENITKIPDVEERINPKFDENIEIASGKVVLDYKLDKLEIQDKILVRNIELKIIGPEKICIVGRNGVGKTCLIKLIIQELEKSKIKLGYMPQSYFEFERDSISAIDYLKKSDSLDEHTRISTLLGSLNFKREEMYRKISALSGGQKAKLFFAKMNMDGAQVLILDEPTRNLSPLSQPEVIESLKNFNGAIISVSHDRDYIENLGEKVYELRKDGLIRVK